MDKYANEPILIIEDDMDDQEFYKEAFDNLDYSNEVLFFRDGHQALDYLETSEVNPFLIISDINLPKIDAFALRDKIRMAGKLQVKRTPYLFFSTSASQKIMEDAYNNPVQGFFIKHNNIADLEQTLKIIVEYWKRCAYHRQ